MNIIRRRLARTVRENGSVSEPQFSYWIDVCGPTGIRGWAVHDTGIQDVRALLNGRPIGEVTLGLERSDVAAARPDILGAIDSGFAIDLPERSFVGGAPQTLAIELIARDGSRHLVERRLWPATCRTDVAPNKGIPVSPFPNDVTEYLQDLRPHEFSRETPWEPEVVERALGDIVAMLGERAFVRPVLRYAHYLRSMSACFSFIHTHFDRINRLATASAKDSVGLASSSEEMLCIANHLYVLQTHGLDGGLVECGCFKGFSTCCLSHACAWLGVKLFAFDSFAGLPPSESDYYGEGEFRGTHDEVLENLRTFGRADVVEIKQGFFLETLPKFDQPFSLIWMDVDLESSSKDVMSLLPALPMRACIFSHECPPESFAEGRPQPHTTEVMPPIVQAFESAGAQPVGTHLLRELGALWRSGNGVPVLGFDQISTLIAAASN
jgi:hypothetical protein